MIPKNHCCSGVHFLPTRREAIKALGSVALLAAVDGGFVKRVCAAVPSSSGVPSSVAPVLQPFALADVRLLNGPFLEAQKRDEAYILKLEPDRLLHNFRVNAGLEPKAPIYGGWESAKTWEGIRCHGHTRRPGTRR